MPVEPLSPDNSRAVSYYNGLFTSQYQMSSNLLLWGEFLFGVLNSVGDVARTLCGDFDIDYAVGNQLDIIGEIVGQNRTLSFQPSSSPSNPIMDDELYRLVLKCKVAINHWDGKIQSIESKWQKIFPDTLISIVDNFDMSMTVSVIGGELEAIVQEMIQNDMIIPRPQGVLLNFAWLGKVFAYDLETTSYAGYDEANWLV